MREPEQLTLDLEGWEGPLDLLLTLARSQKVDLRSISILALVEQYLQYLERAKALRLEIAADYLVMAAWLAYLKSCLLLPKDPEIDPSPEELALRLQLRLQRLDAMREAGARLMGRDRLGRDVFVRGADNALWHKWWDGAGWRGYERLDGVLTSKPSALSKSWNRVDVSVRGTDNRLWHRAWG